MIASVDRLGSYCHSSDAASFPWVVHGMALFLGCGPCLRSHLLECCAACAMGALQLLCNAHPQRRHIPAANAEQRVHQEKA